MPNEPDNYLMEKRLIIEAWGKYRPNSAENSELGSEDGRRHKKQRKDY